MAVFNIYSVNYLPLNHSRSPVEKHILYGKSNPNTVCKHKQF